MATIQKRINKSGEITSFRITVSVGYDKHGNQIRRTTSYKPTSKSERSMMKEVRLFADKFEKEVKEGNYFDGSRLAFADFSKTWQADKKKTLSRSTYDTYSDVIDKQLIPVFGSMVLSKIKPLNIQAFVNGLDDDGYSSATVKKVFTVLNQIFRYAFRMELIEDNPCDRVTLPKSVKDKTLHYFTVQQAKTFLHALELEYPVEYPDRIRKCRDGQKKLCKGYTETESIPFQYQPYFYLALFGGFRRGELIALTWRDIDFKNQTVSITKSCAHTKAGQITKSTKTAAGERTIMLPEICFDKLRQWRIQEMQLSLSLGSKWKAHIGKSFDDNYIFIQANGLQMDLATPTHRFKRIIRWYNETYADEGSRLPEIRLHDLRHTSATLLLAYGCDIETVSHRLGHANTSVTLDVYGHALESMDKTASETLERAFRQA